MKVRFSLPFSLALAATLSLESAVSAQQATIRPTTDGTGTVVTTTGNSFNITGGTTSSSGSNLFHSFSDFGLAAGQTANFQSFANVQNVLGRVTGGNASFINGLIQLSGSQANLFLVNPAGMVFGPNASLNVPAAFTATTANGVAFGDRWFNAFGPNDYAALNGNPGVLGFSMSRPGAIINAGNLAVGPGQALSLIGGTVLSTGTLGGGQVTVAAVPGGRFVRLGQPGSPLSIEVPVHGSALPADWNLPIYALSELLTGTDAGLTAEDGTVRLAGSQLTVEAGDISVRQLDAESAYLSATRNATLLESQLRTAKDLTLRGESTVTLRDSTARSLLIAASENLTIEGGSIDIFALNQPTSLLFAGKNLTLRAPNPVGGDAYYFSGENFRVEQPDGSPGDLFSPRDPVIRSAGDVTINDYTGGSLHIFAAGSVSIGNVTIADPDTTNFFDGSVTLSDGSAIVISGSTRPTLDIRAGTTDFNPPGSAGTVPGLVIGNAATGASIITGDIAVGNEATGGTIFLTNQYAPRTTTGNTAIVTGSIRGSTQPGMQSGLLGSGTDSASQVVIDARSTASVSFINTSSAFGPTADAGAITIFANGDVTLRSGQQFASSPSSVFSLAAQVNTNSTTSGRNSANVNLLTRTGNLNIASGITGNNIVLNSPGTTQLSGAVNASTLTTNAGGTTVLGASVTTTGNQVYNDAVRLAKDVVIGASNVSFAGAVDSDAPATPRALTVNAAGSVIFRGAIGGVQPLASLNVNAAGVELGNIGTATSAGVLGDTTVTANGTASVLAFNGITYNANRQSYDAANLNVQGGSTLFTSSGDDIRFLRGVLGLSVPASADLTVATAGGNIVIEGPVRLLEQSSGPGGGPLIRSGFTGNTLARNDDGSSPRTNIGFAINFFGLDYEQVFVNNNGNLTFDSALSTFTPFGLQNELGTRIIAAYFADVDTRNPQSGVVTYGQGQVNGRSAFGVNWPGVGYFSNNVDKTNNFQLVLVNRGDTGVGNFDIEFNYSRIQWETGDLSGGTAGLGGSSARAGFSNGTGNPGTFFELPGSGVRGAFLDSNSTTGLINTTNVVGAPLGRFQFAVRNGTTTTGLPPNLTLNAGSGTVTANGAIGTSALPLGNVRIVDASNASLGPINAASLNVGTGTSTTSSLTAVLNGDVTTAGAQTYNSRLQIANNLALTTGNAPVLLGGNVESSNRSNLSVNTGTGNITAGLLTGLGAVAINSSGTASLNGNIEATTVVTDAPGTTVIRGNVTTSGNQTYNDPIDIANNNAVLTVVNSNIIFTTLTPGTVTFTASTGPIFFREAIQLMFSSLRVAGASTITTGNITGTGAVNLAATGDITTGNIATSGSEITLTTGGVLTSGTISSLTTSGSGAPITITHQGVQFTVNAPASSTPASSSGTITSSTANAIQSGQFTGVYTQGNIQIIGPGGGPIIPPPPDPIIPPPSPIIPPPGPVIPPPDPIIPPPGPVIPPPENDDMGSPVQGTNGGTFDPTTIPSNIAPQLPPLLNVSLPLTGTNVSDFQSYFGTQFNYQALSTAELQDELRKIGQASGKQLAIISVDIAANVLTLTTPDNRTVVTIPLSVSSNALRERANDLRREVADPANVTSNRYLSAARQLYSWLIAPLEADLTAQKIDTLIFQLDAGLRLLPLAALNDGQRFLIEKYALSLIPSVNLINLEYAPDRVRQSRVLAMGASTFKDDVALPAVPAELQSVTREAGGSVFLNKDFTIGNLKAQSTRFGIVHLATHADFNRGSAQNSYIKLDDSRLGLDQLRELGWNKQNIELLVLSACRTAFGDNNTELGFAGLAIGAGVKTAVATLWRSSDVGTFALMTEFYEALKTAAIKADALRTAQLAMLRGEVRVEGGRLRTPKQNIALPSDLKDLGEVRLSHPYYWSGFTMIGSPW